MAGPVAFTNILYLSLFPALRGDIVRMLAHTHTHKPLRKITVAICMQSPGWQPIILAVCCLCFGALQAEERVWSYMTLNVLTEVSVMSTSLKTPYFPDNFMPTVSSNMYSMSHIIYPSFTLGNIKAISPSQDLPLFGPIVTAPYYYFFPRWLVRLPFCISCAQNTNRSVNKCRTNSFWILDVCSVYKIGISMDSVWKKVYLIWSLILPHKSTAHVTDMYLHMQQLISSLWPYSSTSTVQTSSIIFNNFHQILAPRYKT